MCHLGLIGSARGHLARGLRVFHWCYERLLHKYEFFRNCDGLPPWKTALYLFPAMSLNAVAQVSVPLARYVSCARVSDSWISLYELNVPKRVLCICSLWMATP